MTAIYYKNLINNHTVGEQINIKSIPFKYSLLNFSDTQATPSQKDMKFHFSIDI